MKTSTGFVVTLFLIAFAFAPSRMFAVPAPPPNMSFTLISPKAGQVLYPGQKVKVEWEALFPKLNVPLSWCEMEVFLSLDGGRTYTMQITPSMDPRTMFFYWVVPNMPTNLALLDIRFGCEPFYPETYNTQTSSSFLIAQPAGLLY